MTRLIDQLSIPAGGMVGTSYLVSARQGGQDLPIRLVRTWDEAEALIRHLQKLSYAQAQAFADEITDSLGIRRSPFCCWAVAEFDGPVPTDLETFRTLGSDVPE
jgi:hypothetical protein